MARSSSRMAWASASRASFSGSVSMSGRSAQKRFIRSRAQKRFTAVGREVARKSVTSLNLPSKSARDPSNSWTPRITP